MRDVYDFAKYFIKNGADSMPNTYEDSKCEIINGVRFYFDGITLTDDMVEYLEEFSLSAEDDAYSMYFDNGRLVIY